MLETPQIVQTTAQPAAVIRLVIPKDQIQHEMGRGFGELMAALSAQGLTPAGPFFSHHFRIDPEVWDFAIGVPVSGPVTPAGRVVPGELPAGTVARTVYQGSYDGLGEAWGEFHTWLVDQGHTPAADLWECYVSGPESSPDPGQWRTELNNPLQAVAA